MDDQTDEQAASGRIEVGGLGGTLSVASLRSLLDPVTREEALIELDLSRLSVAVPAAALHELLARVMPEGAAEFGGDGVTVRPGGGAPGARIRLPVAGVRVRLGVDGLRVDADR